MNKRELINICLEWTDATEAYPFDIVADAPEAWAAVQHKANKKTFAFISVRKGKLMINLKCNPVEADLFRQMFKDCTPGFHMNKEHWNTVYPDGDVPFEMLKEMIEKSYELTKPKSKEKSESAEAVRAFKSSISKCEKARAKLKDGSPQRKWVDRQLEAFYISVTLIEKSPKQYGKAELEAALGTLKILAEKVEKVKEKFTEPSPQRTLAERRIKAFKTAIELIEKELKTL